MTARPWFPVTMLLPMPSAKEPDPNISSLPVNTLVASAEPSQSARKILMAGSVSLRKLETPLIVPPVPDAQTNAWSLPCV
jgi:hypothetical protein